MTTKVKSYRINITNDAQEGDAIVIGQNGGMTSSHLGTAASYDVGTSEGDIPVLGEGGKVSENSLPSSVMKKNVYDPNNKEADVFDYDNLDNAPTIPDVYDAVVTFTQGGVPKGSISLNQSSPSVISLDAGGVTAGSAIDITNSIVSAKYDGDSIQVNSSNKLEVIDYGTIKSGATAGATAVQPDDIATVATTGSYTDLIDKPTIPSAQIQSDWSQDDNTEVDYIKNKPTIGDATISIQKNGTNVDSFKVNTTTNKSINITMDKADVGLSNVDNTSDIDKPISTATQSALELKANSADLATVATTGSYNDLINKPTIGSALLTIQKNGTNVATFGANATSGVTANITVPTAVTDLSDASNYTLKSSLATVATSGSYNDLDNLPTIPSVIDNLNSTNTDNSLSANQGKILNDKISTLQARGRFLSNWNATTGLPVSFPEDSPYTYKTGDYFDVTVVGETNYRPSGASYTGIASTEVETEDVYTGDTYIYDGTNWLLQLNHDMEVTFANISGQPSDNSNLASALNTKANSSDLSTVATTGSYTDLSNKPTIGDATITIQKNSTTIDTFTTNSTTAKTINISVPTKTSDLSNDSNYVVSTSLSTVATTGDYGDLLNKPSIPTAVSELTNDSGYITKSVSNLDNYTPSTSLATVATSGSYTDLTNTPSLSTVATTGDYGDLLNKPTIPDAQVQTDWNATTGMGVLLNKPTLATVATSGSYTDLSNKPSLATVATSGSYNDLTGKPTIPSSVSQLTNDSGYITKSINNLDNYTLSTDLATVATSGSYVDLTNKPSLAAVATSGSYNDLSGTPDLSVYQTTNNLVTSLTGADNTHYPSAKAVADALNGLGYGDMLKSTYDPNNVGANAFDYNNFINTPSLATVATSGSYNDLSNTPSIPTKTSDLTNDSGFITSVDTKTFTLSSTSDTTNASAAAAFINGGGNAIVILNNIAYSLSNKTSSSMVFKGPATTTAGASSTTINQPTLTFTVSGSTVSAISSTNVSLGSYLEASRNYGTPLTPSYNGSPATKKYVDDSIVTYTAGTGISIDANNVISNTQTSAEWGNITGTLSDQTDLSTALGNKADDSDVVHLTGAETINGVKTFGTTNTWKFDGTNATLYSPSSNGYLYVTRGSGNSAVTMAIKSGANGGTFGTTTDNQFQFRTDDTMRMQIDSGTNGGKVKLANSSIPSVGDDSAYVPSTSWVNTAITNGISGKQDTISDLATIRSGAAAGATALQSGDNVSELTNDAGYITSSSLPGNATSSTAGLIKLGSDTTQSVSANAVSSTTDRTYAIQENSNGQAVVNVPWTDTVQEVGNATITLTQEGNSIGSFTTNSSTAATIDFEYGIEYVTQDGYNALPSSKTTDNRTYLIYEVE